MKYQKALGDPATKSGKEKRLEGAKTLSQKMKALKIEDVEI